MEQTPAHDQANPDLLAIIPEVKRIVEIGCSRGALAKAYKENNKNCKYVGIEIDPDYALLARRYCDDVLVGNIEDLLKAKIESELNEADCWVFGDTLEHLCDPWFTLKSIKSLISPNGSVCACIPNMQHWSVQLRLLAGQLQYEENGLLDKTHLRWFTRITIDELFTRSGYQIETIVPRIFSNQPPAEIIAIMRELASKVCSNPQQAIIDAQPLQYVIKAKPTLT